MDTYHLQQHTQLYHKRFHDLLKNIIFALLTTNNQFMRPLYQMSIGAQKQIIKGKGTLRFNVRDPFAWQRFKGLNKYGDVDMRFASRPDTRQVTATFSYVLVKPTSRRHPHVAATQARRMSKTG